MFKNIFKKVKKNVIETALIYMHVIQIMNSFLCLLFLYNIMILIDKFKNTNLKKLINPSGALIYGIIIYIDIITLMISLK